MICVLLLKKERWNKLIEIMDVQFTEEDEIVKTNIILTLDDKVVFNVQTLPSRS